MLQITQPRIAPKKSLCLPLSQNSNRLVLAGSKAAVPAIWRAVPPSQRNSTWRWLNRSTGNWFVSWCDDSRLETRNCCWRLVCMESGVSWPPTTHLLPVVVTNWAKLRLATKAKTTAKNWFERLKVIRQIVSTEKGSQPGTKHTQTSHCLVDVISPVFVTIFCLTGQFAARLFDSIGV